MPNSAPPPSIPSIDQSPPAKTADHWTRRAFEVAQIGLASIDVHGVHVAANPAYLTLLGRTRRQVVGVALADVVGAIGVEAANAWVEDPHQSIGFGIGDDERTSLLSGWITPLPYGDGRARAVVQLVPADLNPSAGEGLARFDALADHIAEDLVIVDAGGTITYANSSAVERFDLQPGPDADSTAVADLLDDSSQATLRESLRTARGRTIGLSVTAIGERAASELTITEIREQSGRLLGLAYLFGRPAAIDQVSTSALTTALAAADEAIWVLDEDGPVAASGGARRRLGLADHDPISQLGLGHIVSEDTASAIVRWLSDPDAAPTWEDDGHLVDRDRSPAPAHLRLSTTQPDGRTLWTLVATPIVAAETSAVRDALTDLPNRVVMLDRLGSAIERSSRSGQPTGLVLFDLDRFGPISDAVGPELAARLLTAVSQRLRDNLRPGDVLARSGDDQFAAVHEQLVDIRDAQRFAERIRACVDDPLVIDGTEWFVTLSAGVALTQPGVSTVESLIRNATAALEKAKDSGRARTVVFGEALREVSRRHSTVRPRNHQLRTPAR